MNYDRGINRIAGHASLAGYNRTENKAMNTPTPIIKGAIMQLTHASQDLLHKFGIHRRKTVGKKVKLTQVAEVWVSFIFVDDTEPQHEFHVPIRIVKQIFA